MNKSKSDIFLDIVDSLSRYRRAELIDDKNKNLIEELYVDPLDNDLVLKSMMKNNTTLLIGRKGTGKSTIINRFQHEIRKTNNKISLYIDVNSLFGQAKNTTFDLSNHEDSLSKENIEKLNLHIDFIGKIIEEIKIEIKKNLFANPIVKIFNQKGITKKDFEKKLNSLFDKTKQASYIDITSSHKNDISKSKKKVILDENKVNLGLALDKAELTANANHSINNEIIDTNGFTKILTRYFNIIDFMKDLKNLLLQIPIKNVFICLDDVSEIEKESMEIFTKFIIAPLNNLSDEYFKFKISLYPGRDFLPLIDRQKVKTFSLDYYDLYSMGSTDKVEESAIKYTKKLIEKRFGYYFDSNTNLEDFFFTDKNTSINEYFKILFQISSNVPRIIGKVLEIALQKTNNLEKKITKRILQESAKQHYKNDVEYVLSKTEYIQYKTYDESFEQYHLLQLLNNIIEKAIQNKKKIGTSDAKIFEQYTTNTAPSNYLFISNELENILKTLEFNFFITKFSQQKDKDNSDISIYTLNYGLCMDKNIIVDEKSDRKFRIERVFDANQLIRKWMNDSKELVCKNCNFKFPIEQKDVFIKFKMPCTNCTNGLVELRPLISQKDKKRLKSNLKITKKEFDILNSLNNKSPQTAKELGLELDTTYQSISSNMNKNSKIKNFEFIERHQVTSKKVNFSITDDGKLYLEGRYITKQSSQ